MHSVEYRQNSGGDEEATLMTDVPLGFLRAAALVEKSHIFVSQKISVRKEIVHICFSRTAPTPTCFGCKLFFFKRSMCVSVEGFI